MKKLILLVLLVGIIGISGCTSVNNVEENVLCDEKNIKGNIEKCMYECELLNSSENSFAESMSERDKCYYDLTDLSPGEHNIEICNKINDRFFKDYCFEKYIRNTAYPDNITKTSLELCDLLMLPLNCMHNMAMVACSSINYSYGIELCDVIVMKKVSSLFSYSKNECYTTCSYYGILDIAENNITEATLACKNINDLIIEGEILNEDELYFCDSFVISYLLDNNETQQALDFCKTYENEDNITACEKYVLNLESYR